MIKKYRPRFLVGIFLCHPLWDLETLERAPTCVALGGVLHAVGQIYEEIQSRQCLNLVDAPDIGAVVIVTRVSLVGKPETDSRGAAIFVFQHHLVEIPWCGNLQTVGVVGVLRVEIISHRGAHCACHDVEVAGFGHCLQCTFEAAPNAAIETSLNLRSDIDREESLLVHCLRFCARSRRQKMPLGVVVGARSVGERARLDIRLTSCGYQTAVHISPIFGSSHRAQVAAVERIRHPIGSSRLGVVTYGVVACCVTFGCGVVEGVSEEVGSCCFAHHNLFCATHSCGHFEPLFPEGGLYGRLIATRSATFVSIVSTCGLITPGASAGFSSVCYFNLIDICCSSSIDFEVTTSYVKLFYKQRCSLRISIVVFNSYILFTAIRCG